MRIGILFSGRGSNMLALAQAIRAPNRQAQLGMTICNRPNAPGIEAAHAAQIPVQLIDHTHYDNRVAFDAAMTECLEAANIELVCAAGFMRILSEPFVAHWHNRLLNIHPSLLPRFPGLHTHQRVLDAGDQETGCSVHLVRPRVDDGPILVQARVRVQQTDNTATLAARVLEQEHLAYVLGLDMILSGAVRIAGDELCLNQALQAPDNFVLPPLCV